MLILLSPAKSLDLDTPLPAELPHTLPEFRQEAAQLIEVLRPLAPQQVASLMHLSDALAALNVARYAAWSPRFTAKNARPALLTFNGDVYEGLDARSLARSDLDWAQDHLAILSGLYGVLRPLDWMQPYRLEMGTRLATPAGANLYQFWGDRLAEHLNQRLAGDPAPVLLNLASQEYFKAVDRKALRPRVVECVFEDWKGGSWKIISFHAKRARGLMARHAIQQRARKPEDLRGFDAEGWAHDAAASSTGRMVFRRRLK
ncbi:peroxide stress protein YaaA [Acidovorax sp. 210-6]|uniref:peroxide stress protein YaaA n=1 Tax=Acidovorax sp. 210-6 TaxID=2699468 RepID=UPI001389DF13|nr:peroxide stress protein YaaA [Acidovorax sp. 210-6]NCU67288.1 peroxide stress protein YaaA [Acidovorax sp. 210-6]